VAPVAPTIPVAPITPVAPVAPFVAFNKEQYALWAASALCFAAIAYEAASTVELLHGSEQELPIIVYDKFSTNRYGIVFWLYLLISE
jgi:hypothetical protein